MSVIETPGRPLEFARPAWQGRPMRAPRSLTGLLLCLASPAALADSRLAESWRLCRDDGGSEAVAACSSVIAAGGEGRAEALYHRANAQRIAAQRARANGPGPAGADAFDPALRDYDAAIRLRPDYAEAYVNRGVVHYDRGDYDRAIADNDAAIRLRPDFAEAFNNRSLAWYRKGDYARAQADFDRTIKLKQNYGNALIMRPVGSSAEPLG